jgi:hypothetical protein
MVFPIHGPELTVGERCKTALAEATVAGEQIQSRALVLQLLDGDE